MENTVVKDVRDEIMTYLVDDQRSLSWLCKKTGLNYHTMYSTFIQKIISLSDAKLEKINIALGTEFKKH